MTVSVLVAVCTYRRLEDLEALLDSMAVALDGRDADLLVVDNDPDGSAADLVRRHRAGARYLLCTSPGIAAARNAALAERGTYGSIAFVDDDETVEPDWFDALVAGAREYDADVATGPVVSVYPVDAPAWVVRGGFLQRQRPATGTAVQYAATNNVLIRNAALDRLQVPWFDGTFSRSGGSDAELSWRLSRVGASIVWIDSAVVREVVPADRLTKGWIGKRLVRGGNVSGRLQLREESRAAVLVLGARCALVGALQTLRTLALRRHLRADEVGMFAHGIGLLRAGAGLTIREYARG